MGHKNYPMSILFFQFILTISLSLIITCESQQQQPRLLACDPANRTTSTFRFCNTSLSIRDRVNDLIGRLTVQEKILWLVNNAAPVPRLGILRIEWWSEALHGVSNTGPGVKFGGDFPGATSFPQVITTAASFNVSMWEAIGQVVSDEARAMFNGNQAGLTYWSPNVNIFRDPRWGRGQETPGEDPLLTSRYAISYVSGMQGNNSNNSLKVAACCKHFTAYDLDNWNGTDRSEFNAIVSQQDLEETYNVPFKACVTEAKVASVMCSFNEVNGIPTCANPTFLRDTIRAQWHLDGYIVSDCDAVDALFNRHHYTSTAPDAAAATIKAGLDMECGPFLAFHTGEAIKSGKLTVKDVDQALANTLRVQMRLGVFDGLMQQYLNLGPKNVCTPAHQQLALEAAQQGIVLLQNNNQVLPLSTIHNLTVAVIGPNSNATFTMTGNYDGVACNYTSPLEGISRYANTTHEMGCANVSCDDNNMKSFERAENLARGANVTVLVMGLSQAIECEGKDRRDLLLPGHQQELVSRVASASSGPVILILMSGGPIDVTFAKQDPNITSILWVGYPGQAGGAAIADVLFGKVTPGGKLPMTWYPQDFVTKVPMTDMNMHANMSRGYPGRTYRFYNGLEVYSFGYGLSYTSYKQTIAQAPTRISVPFTSQKNFNNNSTMSIEASHTSCETLQHVGLHIDVENIGKMDGTHTVMVFASTPQEFVDDETEAVINKRLVAFEKIHVATATKQRVKIDLDVCDHLSMVDKFGIRRIPLGEHILHIGENLKHTITLQR